MRHLKAGKILGRSSSHRKALFNNLVTSLIKHEKIVTTLAKAKELRQKADKTVTLAKRGDLHSRRIAFKSIKDKEALVKLFDILGPGFAKRNGGYTRIYKLGRRTGDAAKMAVLEWVEMDLEEKGKDKKKKEPKGKTKPKTTVKTKAKEKKIVPKKTEKTNKKTKEGKDQKNE